MNEQTRVRVLVASYLEPEHVERIRAVDPRLEVLYAPELLRSPRYPADHTGEASVRRSADDEARWRRLLEQADVLFDFDYTNDADLPDLAPRVRWIQASSAGIGPFVARRRYHERMPSTVFTTASGIHARPLAEFCTLAMVGFSRGLFRMLDGQGRGRWERFAGTDLFDRTVVIFGYGSIGREVARLARSLGMRTIGIKRSGAGPNAAEAGVDEVHGPASVDALLPRAEFLVLCAPHTPETEGVLGAERLALLPRGAVVINVGRGGLVDEAALVELLRSGHLAGAALDVFEREPLPVESPLWSLPNVLVCPHSAGTSDRENARLTDLFCDNLRRFLDGRPLRNVLDPERRY